jgi:hypothetical protein
MAIGLAVISLLLAGSVWPQATYDHFSYLPLVERQHPPTPTPPGWIGLYVLHGQVKSNATPAVPLVNAVVSYTRFSYVFPQSAGITLTDSSGAYAFAPINIRDTDSVNVYAQAQGFAPQQIRRTGIELRGNPPINFALIPLTSTAAPVVCSDCRSAPH